jgi:hypothetical protein
MSQPSLRQFITAAPARVKRGSAFLVIAAVLGLGFVHSSTTQAQQPANSPVLAINIGPATVTPGTIYEYTYKVTNKTANPLLGVEVAFLINGSGGIHRHTMFLGSDKFNCQPGRFSNAPGNPNVVGCTPFTLGPHQTETLTVRFKALPTATCGDFIDGLFDVKIHGKPATWSNAVRTLVVCATATPTPTATPTITPTPTATPTPPPTALTCSPELQFAVPNQTVSFSTNGGAGAQWNAPNANVTSGTGATFSTSYPATATGGAFFVTVQANQQSAFCKVIVNAAATATPTPTATPTATVTPTPRPPQCSDNIDNDGDGLIDFPNDPGCFAPHDDDEFHQILGATPTPAPVVINNTNTNNNSNVNNNNSSATGGNSNVSVTTGDTNVSTGSTSVNVETGDQIVRGVPAVAGVVHVPHGVGGGLVFGTSASPISVPITAKTGSNFIGILATIMGSGSLVRIVRKHW